MNKVIGPAPKNSPLSSLSWRVCQNGRLSRPVVLNGAALQCRLHLIGRFINEQLENGLYIAGRQERMDNYLNLTGGFPAWSLHTLTDQREKKDKIA